MKTRTKVLLDRVVATPLVAGLNLSARALGTVMQRDHEVRDEEVRTIVVAKILGMGSIIQSIPLLLALKRRFPAARLIYVSSRANRAMLERLDCVDEVITIRDGEVPSLALDTLTTVTALARRGIDLYFDLEVYSGAAALVALLSLARNRYGLYRHSVRFKKGLHTHLVFLNVRMPIAQLYLQLFRAIGGGYVDAASDGEIVPDDFNHIRLRDADRAGLDRKLEAANLPPGTPYVVINPNASDLLLERRWPLESFKEAIEALVREGLRVVLTGAPSERLYVASLHASVAPELRGKVYNSAGALTLPELCGLIERASCVVTNDTGPMHLAIAFERPMVCMFGPGSPDHYAVFRENIEVLYTSVVCSPCIYETDEPPCAGNNVCMQLIEPRAVVDAALRLLARARDEGAARSRTRRLPVQKAIHHLDGAGNVLGLIASASVRSSAARGNRTG